MSGEKANQGKKEVRSKIDIAKEDSEKDSSTCRTDTSTQTRKIHYQNSAKKEIP